MRYFVIIQFNTLEVVREYAKIKNETVTISYLTQKLYDYSPPFTHVNFLIPVERSTCDPNKKEAWLRVIITHSPIHKGVRLEPVSTPVNGQYHVFIECTQAEIETMRMVIAGILDHQADTYCSITMPNVILSYTLFRIIPKCLRPSILPLPHFKQKGWHCSELSTFLLQAGGVISRHIYPFFITPTDLFLLCYHSPRRLKHVDFKTVFQPTGLDGWHTHYPTTILPYEITPDTCLGVEYFRSYHEKSSETTTV